MAATAFVAVAAGAVGCRSSSEPDTEDAVRCPAGKASAPLVVGMDDDLRAKVEDIVTKGLVVARAETQTCDVALEILTDCVAPGRYQYVSTADDLTVLVKQPKDVPRALPLADVDVRGAMALYGALKIQVARAGLLRGPERLALERRLLRGSGCGRATHIVRALEVGAFAVAAVEPPRLDKLGDLFEVVPGLGHKTVLKEGRRPACTSAAQSKRRSPDCDQIVRMELARIASTKGTVRSIAVRSGRFVRGFGLDDPEAGPAHEVDLDPFFIDATEVSVADYQRCVAAGRCTAAGRGRMCNAGVFERAAHPINCVSWNQARAYCAFVGKRLPTEAEWERAALGEHTGPYPWGEDWPPPNGTVNLADTAARRLHPEWSSSLSYLDGYAETAPVGVLEARSASGIRDLAGNVMEWTSDVFAPYRPGPQLNPTGPDRGLARVVRGSSFGHARPDEFEVARRRPYVPSLQSAHIGFRCAKDRRR